VVAPIQVGTLNLSAGSAGAIAQPGQTGAGSDITVTNTFNWTGGTLNSSANLATLHLQDATATITPNGSTLATGDNLSLEDISTGSNGTVTAGTINLNNAASLYVGPLSTLLTDTTNGNVNFLQPAGQPTPKPSVFRGTWTIDGGQTSTLTSVVTVIGEVKIIQSSTLNVNAGMGNFASIGAGAANGGGVPSGIITIQNGSTLQVLNGVVVGTGGLLQTVPNPSFNPFNLTDQRGTPAKITGDLSRGRPAHSRCRPESACLGFTPGVRRRYMDGWNHKHRDRSQCCE
jgi:hypothetical protein